MVDFMNNIKTIEDKNIFNDCKIRKRGEFYLIYTMVNSHGSQVIPILHFKKTSMADSIVIPKESAEKVKLLASYRNIDKKEIYNNFKNIIMTYIESGAMAIDGTDSNCINFYFSENDILVFISDNSAYNKSEEDFTKLEDHYFYYKSNTNIPW